MTASRAMPRIASALMLCLAALLASPAGAQIAFPGLAQLPQGDFAWRWGREERIGRFGDFSVTGGEQEFRCQLKGKLLGSTLSTVEIRQMENDLAGSLYFIQEATNTMNVLDQRGELDWATLDCTKPQPTPLDEQKRHEIEEKARQKAVKKLLKERAKEQQEQQEQK